MEFRPKVINYLCNWTCKNQIKRIEKIKIIKNIHNYNVWFEFDETLKKRGERLKNHSPVWEIIPSKRGRTTQSKINKRKSAQHEVYARRKRRARAPGPSLKYLMRPIVRFWPFRDSLGCTRFCTLYGCFLVCTIGLRICWARLISPGCLCSWSSRDAEYFGLICWSAFVELEYRWVGIVYYISLDDDEDDVKILMEYLSIFLLAILYCMM